QVTVIDYTEAGYDLSQLATGNYTLHAIKTVTITVEEEDAQGHITTRTETETTNDITGTVVIAPLALTGAESTGLAGSRHLSITRPDAQESVTVSASVSGTNTSRDPIYTYYDQ